MNPFIPFTPAYGQDFVNREKEAGIILERIPRRGNTAIVGNPHVGKTSLLIHTANPLIFAAQVPQPENYALAEIDFQLFGESEKPGDFWRALLNLAAANNPAATAMLKPVISKRKLDKQLLYQAFQQMGQVQKRVVAFLDEFDNLFNLSAFRTLDFLGTLRTVTMKSGGLTLVTASRLSVAQMNALGQEYKVATRGSDLFNYLYELPLSVLEEENIRTWMCNHLPGDAVDEALLIAGHHPLLLQLAGQKLFDAIEGGLKPAQYSTLRESFVKEAESQFQDIWNYLSGKAQIALIIFVLQDLEGLAGGESFNLAGVEKTLRWSQTEIQEMGLRGTLEAAPKGKYRIGSIAFRSWLAEQKIVATRDEEPAEAFTQWLHGKQFKLGGLITNDEIEAIQKIWRAIPAGVVELAKKALLPGAIK